MTTREYEENRHGCPHALGDGNSNPDELFALLTAANRRSGHPEVSGELGGVVVSIVELVPVV